MIKNYLLTALRTFRHRKIPTIINIIGLSIGLSAALVIYFLIRYDYSFDQYEPGKDRIYRVVSEGNMWKNTGAPLPYHEAIRRSVSGVEMEAAILDFNGIFTVRIPGAAPSAAVFKRQTSIIYADSNCFRFFPREWVAGNPSDALTHPNELVLSSSRAKLYFPGIPEQQIVGKTVIFDDSIPVVVSGIYKDLQENSDFNYAAVISLATVYSSRLKDNFGWQEWNGVNDNIQILVKLKPGVTPDHINAQLARLYKAQVKDPVSMNDIHRLEALGDIHFDTDFSGQVDLQSIRSLILLVVFLLLLASVNFINLSTAQASERAKEIGVRKTLGGSRFQLIFQFLLETFLLTFLAAILSVLLAPFLLRAFSGYMPAKVSLWTHINSWPVILFLLVLVAVISLLAGLYPAVILTGFRPVQVLRNQVFTYSGTSRASWVRRALIIFQFSVAQLLIIGVIVVGRQVHYSLNKDMGFRKEAIVNIYFPFDQPSAMSKRFPVIQDLKRIAGIREISLGGLAPAAGGRMTSRIRYGGAKNPIETDVDVRLGDTAFIHLYDIHLLAGRNTRSSDTASEVLINRSLAAALGFSDPRGAVGQRVEINGRQIPVAGVLEDFHLASLKNAIPPMCFINGTSDGFVLHVALDRNPASWSSTLKEMQGVWHGYFPDTPFDYEFLDQSIRHFYEEEEKLSGLLFWAAGVAILIGCLGLLGLVIFMSNSRMKEIGIRKVLGASVIQILRLLSGSFLRLILLSFLIAVPIAWWVLQNWLQGYAYHTALSWWIFAASGIFMLVLGLGVLCGQGLKSALSNPVDSLRSE